MRKINTIISVILMAVFLTHGVLGSLRLLNVSSIAGKTLAWIGIGVMAAHICIGIILTVKTFIAQKKNGDKYLKQNALFWSRRASGLAILILVFFHIGAFGARINGNYVLYEFTAAKLTAHLLLLAALFIHMFINIRPLLIAKGVIKHKERRVDIFLILSVLVLFFSGAFIFYFAGWQIM